MPSSAATVGRDAEILVLAPDVDVAHFERFGLMAYDPAGNLRWLRRDRALEAIQLRNGAVRYTCVPMSDDYSSLVADLRERLDPANDPGYCAVMILYGSHYDLSQQILTALAAARGDRSGLALICFYCCGDSPARFNGTWDSPLTCTVPRPGDANYHAQFAAANGFTVEEDLAYYIAHSMDLPGEMPGVAVGALMVANSGDKRFFLAKRTSGGAKGTYGTIGGPLARGHTFMDSLKSHAKLRLGLADRILSTFQEGPVLACTNLIGNLDHAVDITFLVTVDEPFVAATSRYAGDSGWHSFEELSEIYEHSLTAPGMGMYASGGQKVLFAPVRNAFEGYCLLLLAGSVGETLIPGFSPRGVDEATRALMQVERKRRKDLLRLAARVHERVMDSSPFLYEQAHWPLGRDA